MIDNGYKVIFVDEIKKLNLTKSLEIAEFEINYELKNKTGLLDFLLIKKNKPNNSYEIWKIKDFNYY